MNTIPNIYVAATRQAVKHLITDHIDIDALIAKLRNAQCQA